METSIDHDYLQRSIDLDSFDTLVSHSNDDAFASSSSPSSFASFDSLFDLRRMRQGDRSSTLSIPAVDANSFITPSVEASSLAPSNNSILCNSPASSELDFTGVHYIESDTPTEKFVPTSDPPSRVVDSRLMGLEELHQLRDCLVNNAIRESKSTRSEASIGGMSLGSCPAEDDQSADTSFVAQLPLVVDATSRGSVAPSECSLGSMLSSTHTLSGECAGVLPLPPKLLPRQLSASKPSAQLPRESVAVLLDAVQASSLHNDAKCRFVFDVLDAKEEGVLSRDGVTAFVEATLVANNLNCYGDLQVDEMINKVFASTQNQHEMTYQEFQTIFGQAVSSTADHPSPPPAAASFNHVGSNRYSLPEEVAHRPSEIRLSEYKPSVHYRSSHVREQTDNLWQRVIMKRYRKYDAEIHWLAVFAAAMVAAFVVKASRVPYDPAAGYTPRIAKGFAQVIMVDACFLLLPICRNFVTFLRRFGSVTSRVPLDKHIEFHKICGLVMLIASVGHVLGWFLIIFHLRTASDELWQKSAFAHLSFLREETPLQLVEHLPMWTGYAMVVIAIIAAPMTHFKIRRGNFNAFWVTHLLFVPFLLLVLVHGLAMWVQPPQAFLWVLPPLLLYIAEKRYRMNKIFGGHTSILRVHFSQDTVAIFMKKPENFHFHPGMYLYLNVPVISRFEWHPFTISSAPEDECLSVHVRNAGDWTGALHDTLKTIKDQRHGSATFDLEADMPEHLSPYPSVFIDGPIGAPSQDYYRYKSVVFVGAGIGVTPFASILRSIVHQWKAFQCPCCEAVTFPRKFQIQKIYFYWITREQESLTWFTETMNQLAELDTEGRLEIHNYFSPLTRESVARPLRALQTFIHDVEGQDIISGLATRQVTHFGRPDWKSELQRIAKDQQQRAMDEKRRDREQRQDSNQESHERIRYLQQVYAGQEQPAKSEDVAVFFCGPRPMGQAIHEECATFNQNQRRTDPAGVTFDFRSEHF